MSAQDALANGDCATPDAIFPRGTGSESEQMTVEGYYAEIRNMGLRRTNVETVWIDSEGITQRVPLPHGMIPEQRQETVDKIRQLRGLPPKQDLN